MSNDILLIGATGFAGRAILPHLFRQYDNVHIISRRKCNLIQHENVHFHVAQLNDEKILNQLLPHCKSILYFAWDSTPGKTALKPRFELNSNLIPLIQFLEILQKYNSLHLLFLSSGGTIYGNTASEVVMEDQPFHPRSYYAASKISSEAFITAFGRQTDAQITILRPTNFYGVGQPYIKGFGIIRTIFEHLLTNTPIEIWGDGSAKRDFLYIEDFVEACLLLLNHKPLEKVQIFNVSSNFTASISDLCELIDDISGLNVQKINKPSRSVDLFNTSIESTKLRSLGWSPKTNLNLGLTRMWEWLCKMQPPAINL